MKLIITLTCNGNNVVLYSS